MFKFHKLYVLLIAVSFVVGCLFGCGKDNEKEGDLTGTLAHVNAGWSKMSVSFDRDILSLQDVDKNYAVTVPISKGKFSLNLPMPEAKYLENVEEWMSGVSEVTIDNKSANVVQARFVVRKDNYRKMVDLSYWTPNSTTVVVYVYVDKNVNIVGTLTTETGDDVTLYNMELNEGWNHVIWVSKKTNGKWNNTLTANGTIPTGAEWLEQ